MSIIKPGDLCKIVTIDNSKHYVLVTRIISSKIDNKYLYDRDSRSMLPHISSKIGNLPAPLNAVDTTIVVVLYKEEEYWSFYDELEPL